jgi:hypothetical protein
VHIGLFCFLINELSSTLQNSQHSQQPQVQAGATQYTIPCSGLLNEHDDDVTLAVKSCNLRRSFDRDSHIQTDLNLEVWSPEEMGSSTVKI